MWITRAHHKSFPLPSSTLWWVPDARACPMSINWKQKAAENYYHWFDWASSAARTRSCLIASFQMRNLKRILVCVRAFPRWTHFRQVINMKYTNWPVDVCIQWQQRAHIFIGSCQLAKWMPSFRIRNTIESASNLFQNKIARKSLSSDRRTSNEHSNSMETSKSFRHPTTSIVLHPLHSPFSFVCCCIYI